VRERAPRGASARRNSEEKEEGETAEKEGGRRADGAREPEEPTRHCHATSATPQEAQDSRPRHALPCVRHALPLTGTLMLAVTAAPTHYLCDPTYYLAMCSTSPGSSGG
jgi:hypothetical protein